MRLITLLFLNGLFLVGLSCAASAAQPQPPDLQPLPPPPSVDSGEAPEEPQITIIQQPETTVEEYRISGRLYMIKITPKVGKPYYLVDDRGDGKFSRQESLDSGVRPPRWVIHSF